MANVDTTEANGALSIRELVIARSDGVRLVDDVSFDLQAGTVLGLVGESGSGKTLTSLAIVGALPPELSIESGSISIGGSSSLVHGRRTAATDVAIVFQDAMSCLNPAYTIGTQMRRILARRTTSSNRSSSSRIEELLSIVGMPEPRRVTRQYPHQLSGGMRQRVMIAIAVGVEPRVLVADEPTTALDVTVQAQILELLKSLRAELGLSILMVTHDLGVVADLCDDVVVMRAGSVVESGDTMRVFADPKSPYTRELLDATRRLEEPSRVQVPPSAGGDTEVEVEV